MIDASLLIDGDWISAAERERVAIENPASGETIGHCPVATEMDIDRALTAAARAFRVWSGMTPIARSRILRDAAGSIRRRSADIAALLSLEQGKTLPEAKLEVEGASEHIEWMAEEGRRAYGRLVPARWPGMRQSVVLEPIGPVAAFSPWNFPATTPAKKLSASLAAGCCCLLKVAEETPLTAVEIVKAFIEAGVPAGAIALLTGDPAQISERLIASPIVRKVSFTGSVRVGRHLAVLAAREGKPATMELGGHAPVLVFADADIESVALQSVAAKFRNSGQVCVSPTRFLVEERVYPAFVNAFVRHAGQLTGERPGSGMGPLANARRLAAIEELVADAVRQGAQLRLGGEALGAAGYHYPPTVLTDMPHTARLLHEEPFGPVATIQSATDEGDAIARANATSYGLAAYAFTRDAGRCARLGMALQAGLVGINGFAINPPETPWGGVKDSGYGREAGSEGLKSYLTEKTVIESFDIAPVSPAGTEETQ